MKPIRSSALKSDLLLRTEAFTTATISSSNMPAAREMMSMWPCVIGSYEPGQTAMRGSGAMDADKGVAVAAFVEYGEFELERSTAVALCHHRCRGRENGRQRGRQLTPEAPRLPVRR